MTAPQTFNTHKSTSTAPAAADGSGDDFHGLVPLNVLIVYEDARAARRAAQVVSRLARHTADHIEYKTDFWRFDLLRHPHWCDTATRNALEADLIIMATHDEVAELPAPVNDWLESCLVRRGKTNTALLALFGSCDAWSISLQNENDFHITRQQGRPAAQTGLEHKSSLAA